MHRSRACGWAMQARDGGRHTVLAAATGARARALRFACAVHERCSSSMVMTANTCRVFSCACFQCLQCLHTPPAPACKAMPRGLLLQMQCSGKTLMQKQLSASWRLLPKTHIQKQPQATGATNWSRDATLTESRSEHVVASSAGAGWRAPRLFALGLGDLDGRGCPDARGLRGAAQCSAARMCKAWRALQSVSRHSADRRCACAARMACRSAGRTGRAPVARPADGSAAGGGLHTTVSAVKRTTRRGQRVSTSVHELPAPLGRRGCRGGAGAGAGAASSPRFLRFACAAHAHVWA